MNKKAYREKINTYTNTHHTLHIHVTERGPQCVLKTGCGHSAPRLKGNCSPSENVFFN